MKKKISIILTLALLLLVFAGCQSANSASGASTPAAPNSGAQQPTDEVVNGPTPTNTTVAAPVSGAEAITKERAEEIALAHAGLEANQVTRLHTEYDRDDGVAHYDVEFHQGGYEYDYEIHAQTGEILKSEKERD